MDEQSEILRHERNEARHRTTTLIGDYNNSLTQIGNLLGLKGRFCVDFGFNQITQAVKDLMED